MFRSSRAGAVVLFVIGVGVGAVPVAGRLPTRLVTGDCSAVFPPCWQELHYLIGGAWLGSVLGLVVGIGVTVLVGQRVASLPE